MFLDTGMKVAKGMPESPPVPTSSGWTFRAGHFGLDISDIGPLDGIGLASVVGGGDSQSVRTLIVNYSRMP